MVLTTHQLLQPEMGLRLPLDVRAALLEMGTACNQAAVHLHQALTFTLQVECALEAQRTGCQAGALLQQVTDDLRRLADQNFEQAIIVLAKAGTVYAGYASQVAVAVAAGEPPPLPGSQRIAPSDLITAAGLYLPDVRFSDDDPESRVVAEQNEMISEARQHLLNLITHQMQGAPSDAYDDIATVVAGNDGGENRLAEFPAALHTYASVLVWALSVFSGVKHDG
ncbi:hypothetical protein GCM10010172_31900 [Paractinoplanes ferrugineus]|uniref:Uncharacterized protein n=1 Tax=Paractinoplanes ferrugineus TaxID=113564 RepID=A0A919MFT5_9ACTN|nr:hypothetical protein [Actinoplanes ferrugineus]GIE14118.1 hypothetical protein Afe05nite_59580 [Actinoplanes ferrugineus]